MENRDFKRQSLRPFLTSARPVWLLKWINRTGQRVTASLGTRDETEAKAIALDLERLVNDPASYLKQPTDKSIAGMDPKALQLFFDIDELPQSRQESVDVSDQLLGAEKFLPDLLAEVRKQKKLGKKFTLRVGVPSLDEALKQIIGLERQIATLQKEKTDWERERSELRAKLNRHCSATIADAIAKFQRHYATRAKATQKQMRAVLTSLKGSLGENKRVGEVTTKDLNAWLETITGGIRTKKRIRAYARSFWGWVVREYQLNSNAAANTHRIQGTVIENIVAIRSFDDLNQYLDDLKPWPYWRAWVAFACLAGARWGEQASLKTADVFIDDGYCIIRATKTGRQRQVPLERSILLPILRSYMADRENLTGNRAESDLFFPSIAAEGHGSKGFQWQHTTFSHQWSGVGHTPDGITYEGARKTAKKQAKKPNAEYWNYGPAQWRHCAGTAMGSSGCSSLQISQWLGNSESIARRHYIAPVGARPWPLKWY